MFYVIYCKNQFFSGLFQGIYMEVCGVGWQVLFVYINCVFKVGGCMCGVGNIVGVGVLVFYDIDFFVGGLGCGVKIFVILVVVIFVNVFVQYLKGRLGIGFGGQFSVDFYLAVLKGEFGIQVG